MIRCCLGRMTSGAANQMVDALDMNGQALLNLRAPVSEFEPLRVKDFNDLLPTLVIDAQLQEGAFGTTVFDVFLEGVDFSLVSSEEVINLTLSETIYAAEDITVTTFFDFWGTSNSSVTGIMDTGSFSLVMNPERYGISTNAEGVSILTIDNASNWMLGIEDWVVTEIDVKYVRPLPVGVTTTNKVNHIISEILDDVDADVVADYDPIEGFVALALTGQTRSDYFLDALILSLGKLYWPETGDIPTLMATTATNTDAIATNTADYC
jgi:hypothetical protein